MFSQFIHLDQSVFLFFNGLHCSCADFFFYWVSNRFIWIPLYIVLLFFIIRKWGKKTFPIIIALVISIFVSDQSCNLIKKSVQRPRPSHETALDEQVHLIAQPDGTLYTGGPFGFPSSHAANSITLAFYIIFYLAKNKKWLIAAMLGWVLLLSYSRLYLGVHYPGDLLAGWCVGTISAFLGKFVLLKLGIQDKAIE